MERILELIEESGMEVLHELYSSGQISYGRYIVAFLALFGQIRVELGLSRYLVDSKESEDNSPYQSREWIVVKSNLLKEMSGWL